MIFTGDTIKIAESKCDYCGALVDEVEFVIMLRGNRDNPTEYGWACPECQGLDSFTATGRKDAIATRLAARSVTLADGSKTATDAEIRRRRGD